MPQTTSELIYFDCNMRLGRATAVRPEHRLDTAGLLDEMDYLNISSALIYHVWSAEWDAGGGNEQLLTEIAGQPRFYPCLVPLPHATGETGPPAEFAARVRELHGAARLYPQPHSYSLSDWCMGPALQALAEAEVPTLLESSQVSWDELAHLVATYPRLPLILLGHSYRANRLLYPLLEKYDNLYLEIATHQAMAGIDDICQRFGPQRLLFGTGLPLLDGGGAVAQIVYANLPLVDKQLIAGGNLARLLNLPWPGEGSGR